MNFGPVSLSDAAGAILAHSLLVDGRRLQKGLRLTPAHIDAMARAGLTEVTVAQLGPEDVDENTAATALAAALNGPHARTTPAVGGRANLVASRAGLLRVDPDVINAVNAVDDAITLATLPDYMRVAPDQLLATIKIIPYAVPQSALERARAALAMAPPKLVPFLDGRANLVMTRTPGFKDSLIDKGRAAVSDRLAALGWQLCETRVVPHDASALAAGLAGPADMTLVLAASATSDRRDVVPAGIEAAGGTIQRVGMPVDPGNLLVLGRLKETPVLGLPGCARSPALNGADWVLERLAAGLPVSNSDIANMGVGGLLKEMPDRPQPRRAARTK